VGGGRLATSLLFRTSGPADEIAVRAKAIRSAVQEKLRAGVDVKDPKIAHFLKLQTEAAAVSLEARRVAAKLATLRASREETLLEGAPGFSGQVVSLDAQIGDLQAKADQSAAALAAIAEATATARDEALRTITTIASNIHAKEHSGLRRRREELVAGLPAKIGVTLSELASIDRALLSAPPLHSDLSAMLHELAAAATVETTKAVELPPEAPQTPPDDAQAVEATPEHDSQPGRCQSVKADGSQCRGRALPGMSACVLHRRAESRPAEESAVASAGA
jgi:hypothetical protein